MIIPLISISPSEMDDNSQVLRVPAAIVIDFGAEFQQVVNDLVETFLSHEIAVGLAAPQIGISIRLIVISPDRKRGDQALVLVNPRILEITGKKDKKRESCMSLPHFAGEVERRTKVLVHFQDRHGSPHEQLFEGFHARVIFHEIDHLDGILYPARMCESQSLTTTGIFG